MMSSRSNSSCLDSTLAGDSLVLSSTLALGQEEVVGNQGDPLFYLEEEQQDEEKEVTTELVVSSLTALTREFKDQKNQEVKEQDKDQGEDGKPSDLADNPLDY